MLKTLIEDRILFLDKVNNWEEAVRISSHDLLEQGYIEESYLDAMIDDIQEFGPYIILTDGVAMPHTRPENGALKTGFSFLKLKKGVLFPNTDIPVNLIFTLSAPDADSHIDAIMKLADVIGDDKTLTALHKVSNKEEFLKIIQ